MRKPRRPVHHSQPLPFRRNDGVGRDSLAGAARHGSGEPDPALRIREGGPEVPNGIAQIRLVPSHLLPRHFFHQFVRGPGFANRFAARRVGRIPSRCSSVRYLRSSCQRTICLTVPSARCQTDLGVVRPYVDELLARDENVSHAGNGVRLSRHEFVGTRPCRPLRSPDRIGPHVRRATPLQNRTGRKKVETRNLPAASIPLGESEVVP